MTFFYEVSLKGNFNVHLSDEHINYIWVDKKTDLNELNLNNVNQKKIFEDFRKLL